MATTIRHVTLKSLGKNKDIDPMKGAVVNPFTQAEYDSLCNTGEWTGGYVEAMGYVAPPMMGGMDSWGGSGSEPDGITYVFDSSGNCTIQYNDSHVYMVNANGATFGLSHPIAGYPTSDFNVLGRYATDNPNYGKVYHNYNIYIPNSSNNTQVDNLTDYVIPHFKEKNRFPKDYTLYNDYLQHLNN